MPQVVAVRFEGDIRAHHLDAQDLDLQVGEVVVAESDHGPDLGVVESGPRTAQETSAQGMGRVIRKADPADFQRAEVLRQRRESAWALALDRIAYHRLEMKVVDIRFAFDGSKMTLYFTADGRVDFRALVKDLASGLRCRVHLLQIGVRDAVRVFGGLGSCGRELCCVTWLQAFEAISMKMAKDQSLFLNPTKFSGRCGKLMCCLRYEHEAYLSAKGETSQPGAAPDSSEDEGTEAEAATCCGRGSQGEPGADNGCPCASPERQAQPR